MAEPPHPVLAVGKVRHVGDPVAVVIAETKQAGEGRGRAARDRLRRTCRRWRRCATRSRRARALVHDDAPGNICYDWHIGDKAVVDAAFAKAAKVVKLDLTNNRLIPNAMEPRAAIGEFDVHSGDYTLYTTSQNPHVIRLLMGAFVLHIPENKLRVVAPDVGGGFGSQDLPLRRGGDRHLGRRQAAPAGEVDRRAHRKLHVRRARPRPRQHRRDGAGRGGQLPRRCASRRWPTWAPICPPSRPACRPICTRRCSPAFTRPR